MDLNGSGDNGNVNVIAIVAIAIFSGVVQLLVWTPMLAKVFLGKNRQWMHKEVKTRQHKHSDKCECILVC